MCVFFSSFFFPHRYESPSEEKNTVAEMKIRYVTKRKVTLCSKYLKPAFPIHIGATKDSAKKSQNQGNWMGQVIKFSSFWLHLSESFQYMVLEQYKMERDEQVHIYKSGTPGR